MHITVIGTGYVGLVAGACLADMGNQVICIDNDTAKLALLAQGIMPIYEPGLEELVKSNVLEKRLQFSNDLRQAVQKSQVCFIAVGTPSQQDGSADLQQVYQVAQDIAHAMNGYKIIVDKSTVPIGTAAKITHIIQTHTTHDFDVVSNPEFLKQGNAVEDFLHPDRVIIGSNSQRATQIMQELYDPFFRTGKRIIIMDVNSAEITKYAANSFLATKISFMNQMANLCEKAGANVEMVRLGMATDPRIGNKFLFPGLGYGGSCFPKDVKALIKTGEEYDVDMSIIKATDKVNIRQRQIYINKIVRHFNGDLADKTFAVWGLSFKPNTNDMRQAPAVTIIESLLASGAGIRAYDPKAMKNAKALFTNRIAYASNAYDALAGADALLLITEWNEFRKPDFDQIKSLMKTPVIFDGRNQYNANYLREKGFQCYQIGIG